MKIGLVGVGSLAMFAVLAAGCATGTTATATGSNQARSTQSPLLAAGISAGEVVASSSSSSSNADTKADEPQSQPMPTTCGGEGSIKDAKTCLPPPAFAKKLCGGIYPEVALNMFAKGTPWTRIWLAGDVEAWNASGGLTHRTKLAFDEEVIVLSRHAAGGNAGGIVMTGAMASYDVLRWDGTCVSVLEGELTTRRPPAPKPAPVPWSRLEETTRRALLTSPKVKATHDSLGKACTSVASANEKKSCDKADRAFTEAVANFVRTGAALPTPSRRP